MFKTNQFRLDVDMHYSNVCSYIYLGMYISSSLFKIVFFNPNIDSSYVI
jgi:hypothetical protein